MSVLVCLGADTIGYPHGGGHFWVFLNWILGLRTLGCEVAWLEGVSPHGSAEHQRDAVAAVRDRLEPFGLAGAVAVYSSVEGTDLEVPVEGARSLEEVVDADLVLSLNYGLPGTVVSRFRRTALLDIDPGLLQFWMRCGALTLPRYDTYFTTGGLAAEPLKSTAGGIQWLPTSPCASLEAWVPAPAGADAAFTTVSHWSSAEWVEAADGSWYQNDKRSGFLPFLDLPRSVNVPLELAITLSPGEEAEADLRSRGWRVRDAYQVAGTPVDYRCYVQKSLGEFSCAKPSSVRMQRAWVSDRTVCYLASGKPAVVQHTGPSAILPDDAGMFRFRTPEEAAACLERVAGDYERQARQARMLAEEHFDARRVAASVLERALS